MTQQPSTPGAQARKQYDQMEKLAAGATEKLVSSQGFSEMLGMVTSNVVAASHMASTGLDQALRMSRVAGRRDVARLGGQIARTEDKLERVLQIVEQLESELAQVRAERDALRAEQAQGVDGKDGSQ